MTSEYVFENKENLVSYIYHKLSDPTPIKLQKAMYFLWAFYAATYGNIDYNQDSEFNSEEKYPRELFKPAFEAWRYGPVDNDVYSWDKTGRISGFKNKFQAKFDDENVEKTSQDREIKLFMDDLLKQIDSVNDFGLVNRSHEDSSYKKVYKDGYNHIEMNPEDIKKDYVGYVKKQSEI